jgi:hypothetical protein
MATPVDLEVDREVGPERVFLVFQKLEGEIRIILQGAGPFGSSGGLTLDRFENGGQPPDAVDILLDMALHGPAPPIDTMMTNLRGKANLFLLLQWQAWLTVEWWRNPEPCLLQLSRLSYRNWFVR